MPVFRVFYTLIFITSEKLMNSNIAWFNTLGMNDVPFVGGKNASLGEMISSLSEAGINVPNGFATTANAYRNFLRHQDLDTQINNLLDVLDVDNIEALTHTGEQIRNKVMQAPLPESLETDIRNGYAALGDNVSVAVRSSATAEDLPEASFAGQQETFLNVQGIDNVLFAVRQVFASLFNDRAISYRVHQGFSHAEVALSAGIQLMVRSDEGSSGVMFTLDTESGFEDAVFITSSWGLGECVVQGSVNPDEFYVYKPALNADRPAIIKRNLGSKLIKMVYSRDGDDPVQIIDTGNSERQAFSISSDDVTALAKMAVTIEKHYQRPMDIEWGRDGLTGNLYILQARPETVQSRSSAQILERFEMKQTAPILAEGRSIGQRIGAGKVTQISKGSWGS